MVYVNIKAKHIIVKVDNCLQNNFAIKTDSKNEPTLPRIYKSTWLVAIYRLHNKF